MHQRRISLARCPRAGAVVFADEQDGQTPQRRDVQRLEADAFFQRPVAEEDGREGAFLALTAGIAAADAGRDAAANDARGGEKPELGIAEVKRDAAPAVEPRGTAKNLRHGAAGIAAAREHMTMIAVGRGDVVLRLEQRYLCDAGRRLPDIKMVVPDKLLVVGELQHCLLE